MRKDGQDRNKQKIRVKCQHLQGLLRCGVRDKNQKKQHSGQRKIEYIAQDHPFPAQISDEKKGKNQDTAFGEKTGCQDKDYAVHSPADRGRTPHWVAGLLPTKMLSIRTPSANVRKILLDR